MKQQSQHVNVGADLRVCPFAIAQNKHNVETLHAMSFKNKIINDAVGIKHLQKMEYSYNIYDPEWVERKREVQLYDVFSVGCTDGYVCPACYLT